MKRSVVTLGEARPPSLGDVRNQRRHLNTLLAVVLILVAATLVVFSLLSTELFEEPLDIFDPALLGWGSFAITLVFAFYILARERHLSRTERALIDERILSAGLRGRLHDLSALSQAGRAVNSVLGLDEVLNLVLGSTQDLLYASEASIMLFDQERKALRVAASVGIDRTVADEATVGVGDGVAGWVAESMEPIILQGDVDDPRFRGVVARDRRVHSAMSAPLQANGEMLGVLNVSITDGDREYTEHDLRALTQFAGQAALSIANARLFERERQAKASLAESDRQRRDFLATLTHDLKTPLTSILGYVQLLQRLGEIVTSDQARQFTEVIERQGKRLLEMVEQLVEVSKLEEGAPALSREPLDLRRLAEDQIVAVRGMAEDRTIELEAGDDVPVPYGDRSAIEHILSNLLENAVKYSPDGARVRVILERSDHNASVSVVDNGPGIDPEQLPHVFDRYRRGKSGGSGTGLGLFIVRNLVQAHGGRVWAENEEGGGTRVTFTLPLRTDREG